MPRASRGEKRSTDGIGNAVKIMRIANCEEVEERELIASAVAQRAT